MGINCFQFHITSNNTNFTIKHTQYIYIYNKTSWHREHYNFLNQSLCHSNLNYRICYHQIKNMKNDCLKNNVNICFFFIVKAYFFIDFLRSESNFATFWICMDARFSVWVVLTILTSLYPSSFFANTPFNEKKKKQAPWNLRAKDRNHMWAQIFTTLAPV